MPSDKSSGGLSVKDNSPSDVIVLFTLCSASLRNAVVFGSSPAAIEPPVTSTQPVPNHASSNIRPATGVSLDFGTNVTLLT